MSAWWREKRDFDEGDLEIGLILEWVLVTLVVVYFLILLAWIFLS